MLSPELAEPMRMPSTSTRLWADLVPRMYRLVRLPMPLSVTCTPGTRLSSSVTDAGCRRSMSLRVNTVLAGLLALRCCTSRLALIRVSDSFSAAS